MNKFFIVKMLKSVTTLCFSLLLCTTIVFAQQGINITGTITDNSGPLPGVAVRVQGTNLGTSTDANGNYSIIAPNSDAVLQFSFIGYITSEVLIGDQRIINFEMTEDSQQLEEIVVIGYGTQTKASVTSAIVSVSTEDLLKSPTTSLGNALAGRLPGFSAIQYSGLPGYDDPTVYIRGVSSLSEGRSRPLILVDGVERSFTQIDPNEVADISILKDAGATAVFGVRGANGVILVTTKRGETGKARVTASGSFGIQQPTQIPNFANSFTYATEYNRAQMTDGVDKNLWTFGNEETLRHYELQDQPVLYPSIDWMDYIMEKYALQNQFNINVSGGTERAKYFVSVGKLFQDGLFKTFSADSRENFKYNRYNYRANLDVDLTTTTTLSIGLGGRIEDRNSPNDGNDGNNTSGDEQARESTIFRYMVEAAPMSGAGIVDGKWITYNTSIAPMRFVRDGIQQYYARGFRTDVTNVLNFDITLTQKLDMITPGLDFKLKGAYNNRFVTSKIRPSEQYEGMVAKYYPIPVRENGEITGYVLEKHFDSSVLGYEERSSYARDWYFDVSFNYRHRFFDNHNVSALLLYNQTKKYYPGDYTDIPNGYVGIVARVTYDYRMKYLLDLNMGYNGSENFAVGKRYGFFPSASVGWTLSEEEFMKNQNILDYVKIRYSFGVVGNDGGVGRFVYLPAAYSFSKPSIASGMNDLDVDGRNSSGYAFGLVPGATKKPNVREGNLGNPNVSWEKARKQNIGLDIKSLNNRLGFNFDLFQEHRWDILITPSANIPTHFALPNVPAINYGIVDNWGYEIVLSWTERHGDFSYTISPNMSFSRNKRVEILEIPQVEDYLYSTGTKVGQPFGFEFFGFYHDGIEDEYINNVPQKYGDKYPKIGTPNALPDHGLILKDGDCVYVDLNGDGKVDNNDRHSIGYPNYPEYNFGLNLKFSYKRFDFSMLWIGATNTNRNLSGAYRPAFGNQFNGALIQYVADNSWREDRTNALLPRISFANGDNNNLDSRVWLVNSSYARLKNLEMTYNLDMSAVPYISEASIFATGYNLITITKYKANDPETTGAGYGEFFRYPPTRIYNVGIRLSF